MDFTVYILYSPVHRKIYIGYTSDLLSRFASHNKLGQKGYTCKFRPWVVVYTEVYTDKIMAMRREKALKSSSARQRIWRELELNWLEHGFISVS